MSNSFIDFSRDYINTFISRESAFIKDGALVLDAGAGDPDFQNHDNRLHYISYDLAVGQKDWDYSGLDVIGSLEKCAFKDESFDAICCTQVLEHISEPEAALKEMLRILKKRACFCSQRHKNGICISLLTIISDTRNTDWNTCSAKPDSLSIKSSLWAAISYSYRTELDSSTDSFFRLSTAY